jgi:hypothetical protein
MAAKHSAVSSVITGPPICKNVYKGHPMISIGTPGKMRKEKKKEGGHMFVNGGTQTSSAARRHFSVAISCVVPCISGTFFHV